MTKSHMANLRSLYSTHWECYSFVRPILKSSRNKEVLVLVIRKSGRSKAGKKEVCYMKIRRMQSMEYKWCPRQTAESAVRGVYLSTTSEIHKNRDHCFKDFVFSIHLETQKNTWCLVSQVQQYWTVLNRPMLLTLEWCDPGSWTHFLCWCSC